MPSTTLVDTPYFWTDYEQAVRRLQNCIVLYDNKPFYIHRVEEDGGGDLVATGVLAPCDTFAKRGEQYRLDDPLFNHFRDLPRLGFMNYFDPISQQYQVVAMSRRARRNQQHGLCGDNVESFLLVPSHREDAYAPSLFNAGSTQSFLEMHLGVYPSIKGILDNIPQGSSVAFHRNYAIENSPEGLVWLYKGKEKVGMFSPEDNTLKLFAKFAFLKEELIATNDPFCQQGNTIQEL